MNTSLDRTCCIICLVGMKQCPEGLPKVWRAYEALTEWIVQIDLYTVSIYLKYS